MLLLNALTDPLGFVAFCLALLSGITVHECAHAYVADRLGDPTARNQGRVTLNPLAHLDPLGTVFLFFFGFGWGKPVPVNPQYFTRPALDEFLVAIAGPASNLLLASLIALVYRSGVIPISDLATVGILMIQLNLFLMLFNLLPVPPLDGSKFLRAFLGEPIYRMLETSSFLLIILLLIALRTTTLGDLLVSAVTRLTQFLIGG
ncbi:site-2 protease family protein [Candidatus Berkelbacteria bacterium]|nr:site-2 protease family protein [Candidatus Berkelbacteria bacterium]